MATFTGTLKIRQRFFGAWTLTDGDLDLYLAPATPGDRIIHVRTEGDEANVSSLTPDVAAVGIAPLIGTDLPADYMALAQDALAAAERKRRRQEKRALLAQQVSVAEALAGLADVDIDAEG